MSIPIGRMHGICVSSEFSERLAGRNHFGLQLAGRRTVIEVARDGTVNRMPSLEAGNVFARGGGLDDYDRHEVILAQE